MKILYSFAITAITFSITPAITQAQNEKIEPDTSFSCGCPDLKFVSPGFRYYPALTDEFPYPSISDMTGWSLAGGAATFKNLYTKNRQFSGDEGNFWSGLSIISNRAPIRLIHPDKTFTINLTPCKDASGIFEIPLTIQYTHKITRDLHDFNLATFDHTTIAYVHVAVAMYGGYPESVLRDALDYMVKTERNGNMDKLNQFLTYLNHQYATDYYSVSQKNYKDGVTIANIITQLKANEVNIEKLLTDYFISTSADNHRINQAEIDRMNVVFGQHVYIESIEKFEREVIRPKMFIDFNGKILGIEISPAILHEKKQSANNMQIPLAIYAYPKAAYYISEDGLKTIINKVCFAPAEITGTGIGITFKNAELLSYPEQTRERLIYTDYPLFEKNTKNKQLKTETNANKQPLSYDTLLTKFTGLFVKNALLEVRYNKSILQLPADNLIVNNNLISGKFVIGLVPKSTTVTALLPARDEKNLAVSLPLLMAQLKKDGLKLSLVNENNRSVTVYFKKVPSLSEPVTVKHKLHRKGVHATVKRS